MLIKITENKYLNADYILALLLGTGDEDIAHEGPISYKIVARMIDNSTQLLVETTDEKKAKHEFARLLKEANKRIKEIRYE